MYSVFHHGTQLWLSYVQILEFVLCFPLLVFHYWYSGMKLAHPGFRIYIRFFHYWYSISWNPYIHLSEFVLRFSKEFMLSFFKLVLCYKIIIFRLIILYSVCIWISICTRNFITGTQEINIFRCHSLYSFSRYKKCCNFFSIAVIDISGFKLCSYCWFNRALKTIVAFSADFQ